MTSALIDTHCHIDAYDDPKMILDAARAAAVHVVAVTEDPGSYRTLRTRLGRREGVEVALGLHPLRASQTGPHDLARFLRLLPQAPWVGEVGLDFSRAGVPTRRQLRVFDALLADPHIKQRPVTVHSRGAESETVSRLAQAGVTAILHWYTGSLDVAEDALAAGLWFSVNPAMTRSQKGEALLQRLPADRVLLETDGPYARHGNRAASPADLNAVLMRLARVWNTSIDLARTTLLINQQHMFDSVQRV